MRDAIRDRLVQKLPEVGNRVMEPFMAGPTVEKPYIVIVFGGDVGTNIREGFDIPIRVWPYVDKTKFGNVDAIANKIRSELMGRTLVTKDGYVFRLRYTGSGDDYYDPEWQALTKRLDFVTEVIR